MVYALLQALDAHEQVLAAEQQIQRVAFLHLGGGFGDLAVDAHAACVRRFVGDGAALDDPGDF